MGEQQGSFKGHDFSLLSRRVIQAAMTVHLELGTGLQEITYQRALGVELTLMNIPFEREVEIPIYYREQQIDTRRADFVVSELLLELKAVEQLIPEHIAQLAMYLKAARRNVGLLINFGSQKLEVKRVVR